VDEVNDSIENILSDANDIVNDLAEPKAENVIHDEPKNSVNRSLVNTSRSDVNIAEKSVSLGEAEANIESNEEIILVKETSPSKSASELDLVPRARICNFLMDSDESDSNNDGTGQNLVRHNDNKKVRLTDIDYAVEDVPAAECSQKSRENVYLVDETVLSSSSSFSNVSAASEEVEQEPGVLFTSDDHESENSNILDQNVLLDDTCLDESSLSESGSVAGTPKLDKVIGVDQSLSSSSNNSSGNLGKRN
jgi:hypothetical protein